MTVWQVRDFPGPARAEEWLNDLEEEFTGVTVHSVVASPYGEAGRLETWLVYTVSYRTSENGE